MRNRTGKVSTTTVGEIAGPNIPTISPPPGRRSPDAGVEFPAGLQEIIGAVMDSPVPIIFEWGPARATISNTAYRLQARGETGSTHRTSRMRESITSARFPAESVLQHSEVMAAVVGGKSHAFEYANDSYKALLGRPDVLGIEMRSVLEEAHCTEVEQAITEVSQTHRPAHRRQLMLKSSNGETLQASERTIDFEFLPIFAEGHVLHGVAIVGRDATAEVLALTEARIAEERWQVAIEAKGSGTWDSNLLTNDMVFSHGWLRMLGYGKDEFKPLFGDFQAHLHPQDRSRVVRAFKACINGSTPRMESEFRILCQNGSYQWVESRGIVVARDPYGNPTRLSGIISDISERKLTSQTQWIEANFDALTGLPNRRLFLNRLESAVLKASRSGNVLALMFIDLDRFKHVNDTYGHSIGDSVLKDASARISQCIRACDTVARLGGDEYTVLLTDLRAPAHMETTAQKIIDAIASPFQIEGQCISLTASVGLVLYARDAASSVELISHADHAMYAAKNSGGNKFCFFTPDLQRAATRRMQINTDLKKALANDELRLTFQPMFNLGSMVIAGAEALVHWDHPQLGILTPAEFFQIAFESDQLGMVDNWMLCRAAKLAHQILKATGKLFPIHVKRSFGCTHGKIEAFGWIDLFRKLKLPPGAIGLEVGEVFMHDIGANARSLLNTYRRAGISIILADYGAGAFSIAEIYKQQFAFLKLDLGQISESAGVEGAKLIVQSALNIADSLHLRVVVAGIETSGQKTFLRTTGASLGQGCFLSRPIGQRRLLTQLGITAFPFDREK